MTTENPTFNPAEPTPLPDEKLDTVAGGERHQVTLEEYEKILATKIAQNKSGHGSSGGHGASGSW